jgi:hypothetical protein
MLFRHLEVWKAFWSTPSSRVPSECLHFSQHKYEAKEYQCCFCWFWVLSGREFTVLPVRGHCLCTFRQRWLYVIFKERQSVTFF